MTERRTGVGSTEIETERLREFLNTLWIYSTRNSEGKGRALLFPLSVGHYLSNDQVPAVEVEVSPQVSRNLSVWQEITNRLLVTPSTNIAKIGLSFYEEGLGGVNKVRIPVDKNGEQILELKYSNIKGVADLEIDRRKLGHFPSQPENGRANLRFRIIEMFNDSRRELLKRYVPLNPAQRKRADSDLLDYLKQTEMASNPSMKEEWDRLKSTPLAVYELIGRTTYWDLSRGNGVPQPINFGGFKITETLGNDLVVEKLTPSVGYNSWKELDSVVQHYLHGEWKINFPTLNRNLTSLMRAFR